MSRWIVFAIVCLCVVAPVKAQDTDDAIPELSYLSIDDIVPIARFGWGVPYDIEFFPDNDTIAVATGAGITIYDHTLTEQRYIPTNEHAPHIIAISPDGRLIASGGADVRLWDVETGALIDTMNTGHGIGGIAFNADGSLIAVSKSWSGGGGIYIFETASGREQAHLIPDRIFQEVVFHPDGEHLIAQQVYDCCGTVAVIDLANGARVNPDIGEMRDFLISPEGDEIIAHETYVGWGAFDFTEPETMTRLRSREDFPGNYYVSTKSPINEEGIFSVLTRDGELTRWDSATLTPMETYALDFEPRISAISADGQWVAAINPAGSLAMIDFASGERWERNFQNVSTVPVVLMGDRVFYVTPDNRIGYWDIWTDEFGLVSSGQLKVNALLAGADGSLYSAGEDGSVLKWDAENADSDPVVVYQQSGVSIRGLVQGGDQLFILTCVERSGQLLRIDLNTGESLGFVDATTAVATDVPAIDIPDCFSMSENMKDGNVSYTSAGNLYIFSDSIDMREGIFPLRANDIYMDYDKIFLIADRAVLQFRQSSQPSTDQLEVVVTHNQQITAFTPLEEYLYVSAACALLLQSVWDGYPYCYGVDMAVSGIYASFRVREPLHGHSGIVRQIIRHETLSVFVSLSEDGTMILWGAPLQPQPIRRGAGARLYDLVRG